MCLEPEQLTSLPVVVTGNKLDLLDKNEIIAHKQERAVIAWCQKHQIPYIRTRSVDVDKWGSCMTWPLIYVLAYCIARLSLFIQMI